MVGLRWRLILDPPRAGGENMARDHALALRLGEGEGVLRFYGWTRPTVSFGRNEPARGVYDREQGAARGLAFVRRPTGGRAVLHHREVTYAVVVPDRALGGPRDAYAAINRGLVRGLAELGVEARVAGEGPVPGVDAGPCFRAPAPGEITAGGRKLVGSAQVRLAGVLLQHGSVILAGGQGLLGTLRGEADDPADAPAAVATLVGRDLAATEVAAALARGCRLAWGGAWAEAGYRSREEDEAVRLLRERYASDDWTWRR